jgi:hypothetical protein
VFGAFNFFVASEREYICAASESIFAFNPGIVDVKLKFQKAAAEKLIE